jgi:alpha-N-arabinofuranosidase
MRDALLAALTLDAFHRHADKVVMANVAQLVNCLHSMFLAHEDRFVATPSFHVFEMYGQHVGGRSLPMTVSAPAVTYQRVGATGSLWGLAGSASIKGRTVTMTVVNPHVSDAREAEIALRGASIASIRADVLRAPDIHGVNTFERPTAVMPQQDRSEASHGNVAVHRFSPASVTRLTIGLA